VSFGRADPDLSEVKGDPNIKKATLFNEINVTQNKDVAPSR
jgi:hypothetical protein